MTRGRCLGRGRLGRGCERRSLFVVGRTWRSPLGASDKLPQQPPKNSPRAPSAPVRLPACVRARASHGLPGLPDPQPSAVRPAVTSSAGRRTYADPARSTPGFHPERSPFQPESEGRPSAAGAPSGHPDPLALVRCNPRANPKNPEKSAFPPKTPKSHQGPGTGLGTGLTRAASRPRRQDPYRTDRSSHGVRARGCVRTAVRYSGRPERAGRPPRAGARLRRRALSPVLSSPTAATADGGPRRISVWPAAPSGVVGRRSWWPSR